MEGDNLVTSNLLLIITSPIYVGVESFRFCKIYLIRNYIYTTVSFKHVLLLMKLFNSWIGLHFICYKE